jgi:hypothetical protein
MPVHLIKLAVGVRDIEQLAELQQGRQYRREGTLIVPGFTRRRPRRPDEVTDGGSIYWVIKGVIRCRQRVLDFETVVGDDGISWCRLILDPTLIRTVPEPKKAFQGWRYLDPATAPRDLDARTGEGELPAHLLAELRDLGLA